MGRNGMDQKAVSWAFFILPYLEETALYNSWVPTERVDDDKNAGTMRTPIESYACPSRRRAAADRNFDNNNQPPLVLGAATLADYSANTGIKQMTGMTNQETSGGVLGGYSRISAGPIFTASRIGARQVEDGLSKTLAIGERHLPPVPANTKDEMKDYEIGDTAAIPGDTPHTTFRCTEGGLAASLDDPSREKFGSSHASGTVQFVFLDGHVAGLHSGMEVAVLEALSTIGGGEVTTNEN
jgi:prepilin-type processing-associated H-X9-DG protein